MMRRVKGLDELSGIPASSAWIPDSTPIVGLAQG